MKFPSDDQDVRDYVPTNQLLRNQEPVQQLNLQDVEIIDNQSNPSTDAQYDDEEEGEEEGEAGAKML
jgi:hypothetical protein